MYTTLRILKNDERRHGCPVAAENLQPVKEVRHIYVMRGKKENKNEFCFYDS